MSKGNLNKKVRESKGLQRVLGIIGYKSSELDFGVIFDKVNDRFISEFIQGNDGETIVKEYPIQKIIWSKEFEIAYKKFLIENRRLSTYHAEVYYDKLKEVGQEFGKIYLKDVVLNEENIMNTIIITGTPIYKDLRDLDLSFNSEVYKYVYFDRPSFKSIARLLNSDNDIELEYEGKIIKNLYPEIK